MPEGRQHHAADMQRYEQKHQVRQCLMDLLQRSFRVAAIAIVYTPIFARVVRGPALSLKRRDFVDAARTFGSSQPYILPRHLLLNLLYPLTAPGTFAPASALPTGSGPTSPASATPPPPRGAPQPRPAAAVGRGPRVVWGGTPGEWSPRGGNSSAPSCP